MTSHDRLFKELFQDFLAELLSLAEPEALGFLNLGASRFLDKETFTGWPEGLRREVDLLAMAPVLENDQELFLVHVEIERDARSTMGHRLWVYSNLLQGRHGVPVLTILVNLRGGRAGARRETVRKSTSYREVSTFVYTSFSLSACWAEEYLERPVPLAWALAALMRPGSLGRAGLKIECLRRLARAGLDQKRLRLLVNCVETYLQLDAEGVAEYESLLALDSNREVSAMEMTWEDKIMKRGEARGARKMLLSLLGERFGKLPESVRDQVEAIESVDRLNKIAGKVHSADSLDELKLR